MADIFRFSISPIDKNSFFARNFLKSKFQGLVVVAIDSSAENTSLMIYFIPVFGLDKEKIDIFQFSSSFFKSRFCPFFFLKLKPFYPYNFFIRGRRKNPRAPTDSSSQNTPD